MKKYDDLTARLLERRDRYMAEQKKKKQRILRVSASLGCFALVTLAGVGLMGSGVFDQTPPVTPASDKGEVTTTTIDVPTESEGTTTTTTANTTAPAPTTDGGIVTPPTTVTTVAPTTTAKPTTGKTEPPKTTKSTKVTEPPKTTPSKTEPSKTNPTASQTKPTATQTTPTTLPTTAPTQSKPQPTTTPTVPQKIVITADEPDVYGDASPDGILSLYKKYISPALQEKMKLHSSDNVVFSVIVELPITVEDYNSFSSTDEELLRLEKERDIASQEFEDALEQYGWTEDVREMQKKLQRIASEWEYLLHELTMEYLLGVLDQRINELTHLSENAPIPISTDTRFKPLFAFNADYAFFMELTADEINELAERGGYVIRLVFPDGDGEIIVLD